MSTALLPEVPAPDVKSIRLVGGRLIDGTGNQPIDDAEIVMEGDRLTYVGPRRSGNRADEYTVDVDGATIMPGFIDCHIHAGMSIEVDPAYAQRRFPSEQVIDTVATLHQTLMAGVTTARDLGGLESGYRQATADGKILGPRLHLALVPLSPTGGHTDFHLSNGASVNPGIDVIDPIVDSDDDVRRAVRLLVRSGADTIKICTTGGVSSPTDTPDDIGVPEEHVRLIVEEMARRQGQPIAAHAQGNEGILQAIRGGVASVEHGYEIDEESVELMVNKGTFLVPTLSSALRIPSPDDVPDYLYEKKVKWSAIAREHVSQAISRGIKVAMGTDSGVCPHGLNLKELGHMVELGMEPMGAIVAGTKNAAELLRLDEDLGTLEVGKLADLVISDVDPLTDIEALADPACISGIIQGGRLVKDTASRFLKSPHEASGGA